MAGLLFYPVLSLVGLCNTFSKAADKSQIEMVPVNGERLSSTWRRYL